MHPALEDGLIEMTIPEKPSSSKQKYRLTEKGRVYLEGENES
jgi:ATP-dependent DNA helicase RecG